ncbi:hypothetical protein ON010_g16217 [Phytophthora cinnamomi]|nr:hypothetical protein ON010_g16217 [Phytophthora cinnamomi]
MAGSFNLYRAQVKAFLHRFNAWGLVDGTILRPAVAGPGQQQYDQLDGFVKDTLLRGAKVEDAERLCDLPTASEMWEDLEAHHTKREFSNFVWVMKTLFHATYSREQTMDAWLQEIHDTRRALANLGRVIDDDLTVDVIIMGVVRHLVEKMNSIMLRAVRAMLVTTGLPTSLWGEGLKFAVTVYNFSPTKANQGCMPYELYEGRKPDVSGLRVWGCAVTYFVPKKKRKGKHAPTAREALFLGYPETTTGYRMLDLVSGRIVESRDVKCREQWTVAGDYVSQLLEKVYSHQLGVVLPDTIQFVKLPIHDYSCSDSANKVAVASHDPGDESMDDQEVGDGAVGRKRARTSGTGEIEAAEAASIPKRHKCTGELALSDDAENSDDSLPASENSIEYGDQQQDVEGDQQGSHKKMKAWLGKIQRNTRLGRGEAASSFDEDTV